MRLKTGGLEPGEDRGRDVFALSADSGLARAFSLILTHEGTLPLSLRFLERQGGEFCSPTAEMSQPLGETRKAGPAVQGSQDVLRNWSFAPLGLV
jgi:hypothetical protein